MKTKIKKGIISGLCIATGIYLFLNYCNKQDNENDNFTATQEVQQRVRQCPQSEEIVNNMDAIIGKQEGTALYKSGVKFSGRRAHPLPNATTISNAGMALYFREIGDIQTAETLERAIEEYIGRDKRERYNYGTNERQSLGYQSQNQRVMANLVMAYSLAQQGKTEEASKLIKKVSGIKGFPYERNIMYGVALAGIGQDKILNKHIRTIHAVNRQTRRNSGGTLAFLKNMQEEFQQVEDLAWQAIGMCTKGMYKNGQKHLEKGLKGKRKQSGLYINEIYALTGKIEAHTFAQASVALAYVRCFCNDEDSASK